MDYVTARTYLLNKPMAIEDFPFNKDVAVFKIKGKMFATLYNKSSHKTTSSETGVAEVRMNLKCDPNQAVMLRDIFSAVTAGYHMNKRHWNTVALDTSIAQGEIKRMIDHSYALVVKGLSKKNRLSLEVLFSAEQLYANTAEAASS